MSSLPRRYLSAKIAKSCPNCRQPIELGDDIAPGPRAWTCAACDAEHDDLNHIRWWLEFTISQSRTPTLRPPEVALLVDALRMQNVPAIQRGDRETWHPDGKPTAWRGPPLDANAHGLLLDSLEHGFSPRLPWAYANAILMALFSDLEIKPTS